MTIAYNKYYQTENLFGRPYPELIAFFSSYPDKGKVLDLGCGQGRDSVPLARLGFAVVGIDSSKIGIEQMNHIANTEGLNLIGEITDIYEYENFAEYDFILLNSMFHFTKNDLNKETTFIKRIISNLKDDCLIVFCIQDTEKKVKILNETIDFDQKLDRVLDQKFDYVFNDSNNNHKSKTNYRMIIVKN